MRVPIGEPYNVPYMKKQHVWYMYQLVHTRGVDRPFPKHNHSLDVVLTLPIPITTSTNM
jgi:hypothetical protein